MPEFHILRALSLAVVTAEPLLPPSVSTRYFSVVPVICVSGPLFSCWVWFAIPVSTP